MIPQVRLPFDRLRSLEDRYADRLVDAATAAGFRTIVARAPRAWIDLNRAEGEYDPDFVRAPQNLCPVGSRKVAAGLGIIPRRVAHGGDIWRSPIAAADFADRLDRVHRPYHAAIAHELGQLQDRFGCAFLIDLHSMPPLPGRAGGAADIVIGDLFGRSAEPWAADVAGNAADRARFRWAVNTPYAGGHTIDRHGLSGCGINAIQIEISRGTYLDSARVETGPGLASASRFVADLAHAIADAAMRRAFPIAAE